MNDAHLHLVVNHFPIIGVIFGAGILLVGLIMNNNTTKNVAYILFVVAAIFAVVSIQTGGGAAHVLKETIPNLEKGVIRNHAELAEKLALLLYLLAVVSLIGLYLNIKNHSKAKLVSYVVLLIAAVSIYVGQEVGTSGGEIRHTEIRANATPTPNGQADKNEDGD